MTIRMRWLTQCNKIIGLHFLPEKTLLFFRLKLGIPDMCDEEEVLTKEVLKIHGYVSSSEEEGKDESKAILDEVYFRYKPPPLNPSAYNIIEVEGEKITKNQKRRLRKKFLKSGELTDNVDDSGDQNGVCDNVPVVNLSKSQKRRLRRKGISAKERKINYSCNIERYDSTSSVVTVGENKPKKMKTKKKVSKVDSTELTKDQKLDVDTFLSLVDEATVSGQTMMSPFAADVSNFQKETGKTQVEVGKTVEKSKKKKMEKKKPATNTLQDFGILITRNLYSAFKMIRGFCVTNRSQIKSVTLVTIKTLSFMLLTNIFVRYIIERRNSTTFYFTGFVFFYYPIKDFVGKFV